MYRLPSAMRPPYPSSLSDAGWALVREALPELAYGRRRRWPVRLVADAVFYLVRMGCPWRHLPRDFPPWQTVYYHYRRWADQGLVQRLHAALRHAVRTRQGRSPHPSAGIVDSQSVKTTEAGGVRGYDGGKGVSGRKRHVLVDTDGLLIARDVSAADVSDQAGAKRLLGGLRPLQPRLALVWGDGAYGGRPFAAWTDGHGVRIEVVRRRGNQRGFVVQPRRWVVERTFAWLGRYARSLPLVGTAAAPSAFWGPLYVWDRPLPGAWCLPDPAPPVTAAQAASAVSVGSREGQCARGPTPVVASDAVALRREYDEAESRCPALDGAG